jgi:hypothetical protein
MDLLPSCQKGSPLSGNKAHCASDLAPLHAYRPHQLSLPVGTRQIDLGLTVAKNMHVRRHVIIGENDNAQAQATRDCHHMTNLRHDDGVFQAARARYGRGRIGGADKKSALRGVGRAFPRAWMIKVFGI